MTFIGKLLTVLILICSIVLTAIAVMLAASQQNWKATALDNKKRYETKIAAVKQANDEIAELNRKLDIERLARAQALARMETQLQSESAKLVSEQRQLAALNQLTQELSGSLKQNEARAAQLDADNQTLRTERNDFASKVAQLSQEISTLTDKNYSLEGDIRRLEERRDQLAGELAQLEKVAKASGIDKYSLTKHIVPKLDARILAVSNEVKGLVEISVGKDDGVHPGHEFDVYRENKYLGRIVVKDVTNHRASATVVPELNQAPIKENDRVTSQLESQSRS